MILELALVHRCAFCQPGRVWHCIGTIDTILAAGELPNIFEGHKDCHLLLCSNVSCSLRMFNPVVSGPWFFSLEFFSKPEYVCGCMCACVSVCECVYMLVYVYVCVSAYVPVYIYMCLYVCLTMHVCICVYVVCACMCVCIILSLLYLYFCFIALLFAKTDWTFFIISFC